MFASIRIALTAGLLAAYALSASGQAAGGLSFEDLERLKNAKCTACHDTQKRNVGPSWREIATRYSGDRNALKVLAQRVREGSSGNWGSVPMPPNFLPWNEDAESLVRVAYEDCYRVYVCATRGGDHVGYGVRAVVRQGVALEPRPQILDRVEIRCVGWQEGQFDFSIEAVDVVPYQARTV